MDDQRERVAAIVVTHNRCDILAATIDAVLEQVRPPDTIVVVDNASTDGTAEQLAPRFPTVRWLRLPENLGYGAGLAEGMDLCLADHDWLWLLDDDSPPQPTLLKTLLDIATRADDIGMVGVAGGALRWGVPDHHPRHRPVEFTDPTTYACGFLLVDGAVVNAAAARTAGVPRRDFFMMMEDVEYSGRLALAGWRLLMLADAPIERLNLGSSGAGKGDPWRSYYQTRNHLLTALDRRSLTHVLGWAYRTAKLLVGQLIVAPHRGRRISLRVRGAVDGLRGHTGRTVVARKPADG
jgi:GT2 family glycosyltransferase